MAGIQAERLLAYDEALPGSTQFGLVQILPRGACPSGVGESCSWTTNSNNNTAILTSRDYSIQAVTDQGGENLLYAFDV